MSMFQMRKLVELAEKIYADTLTPNDALRELNMYTLAEGPAIDAIHFLYHFVADADISALDERYRSEQRRHLRTMIDSLQAVQPTA